jgi:hypothetical protein
MNNVTKTFDAVRLMRSAREELSANIEGMTLAEELEWLAGQDLKDPVLTRLREKAAQQDDAAGDASRRS